MRLVFATRNQGKLAELRQLLNLPQVEVVGLEQCPQVPEIEETGTTFAENAALKARTVALLTGLPALADDSGLEVDALGGEPGVHSARYAGPGASDADRNALLLRRLADVPPERRGARFRCVVAFAASGASEQLWLEEGSCGGRILDAPRGEGGFGYDPLFFVEQLGCTFAEALPEQKNRLSHRGRAMRAMVPIVRRELTPS